MNKRVFLIVLDSFGIGEMPDASQYGDTGCNTLLSISKSPSFNLTNLRKMGLFNIEGVSCGQPYAHPLSSFARLAENSSGKDTTIGHWEIAGIISSTSLPVYPDGFPDDIINKFEQITHRKILCNKPYSGTEVIRDYGREHVNTGNLIVYTSADSVFQVAAHEGVVPLTELYQYCQDIREHLHVGRVIARPFTGEYPNFVRTSNRHDYSLKPPGNTMLDLLKESGREVIAVGKVNDIFAGEGITKVVKTINNADGMQRALDCQCINFEGLCFINLVDFDMLYGHRNDVNGYARALTAFDRWLPTFIKGMKPDDILMITADHGCDPGNINSTDHSREYVPLLVYSDKIASGLNLGTRSTFSDIAATVLEYFDVRYHKMKGGSSFLSNIMKGT